MVSLTRLLTTTILRPSSFFSKLKPQNSWHLHTRIFVMPLQWQRAPLIRHVTTQSAREAVIAAVSQKHGHILIDAETMNSLSPAYSFPKSSNPSQADCLMGLLLDVSSEKPYNKEDAEWQKLQKLVNDLDPTVIAETFKRLYLTCSFDGNIQSGYASLALLKLFTGHLLNLPKKEEFSLSRFTEHLKEVILALPLSHTNSKRTLEFIICLKPSNLRSLFWFYLPERLLLEFQKMVKGYEDSIL